MYVPQWRVLAKKKWMKFEALVSDLWGHNKVYIVVLYSYGGAECRPYSPCPPPTTHAHMHGTEEIAFSVDAKLPTVVKYQLYVSKERQNLCIRRDGLPVANDIS